MYCYKWFCKHVLVRFFGLTTVTFTQTDYNYCKVVAGGNLVFFFMSTCTTTRKRQSTDSRPSDTTEIPPSIEKTQLEPMYYYNLHGLV